MAGDGHGGRKQLWRRARSGEQLLCIALSRGGTARAARVAQLGFTPCTWMLLPASSFPCALPWPRLLGVPWASGQPWAGRSELCWPSLSLLSPAPGTILASPRCGLHLGPLLLLRGDREMLKGRREKGGGTRAPPRSTVGFEEDCSASPRGRTGVPRCSLRDDKVPVQRSPCRDPGVTLPEGKPLPTRQPGCSSEGPGEG